MTWSICGLYRINRSFTSCVQIRDPTNSRWVASNKRTISGEIGGFLIVTKLILVESQTRTREVKEWPILHNLHIDHVTIRSELKYLFGAKVVRLKCRVMVVKQAQLQRSGFAGGKTRCNGSVPVPTVTRNCTSGSEPLLKLTISYLAGHHTVSLSLCRITCAADVTQETSTRDLHAHAFSGGHALWHSPVYGRLRPKHAVYEGLFTLAEEKRPEANLLIGLS